MKFVYSLYKLSSESNVIACIGYNTINEVVDI